MTQEHDPLCPAPKCDSEDAWKNSRLCSCFEYFMSADHCLCQCALIFEVRIDERARTMEDA